MDLKLDAAAVQALICDGLPAARDSGLTVEALAPGMARIRLPYAETMLRPGKVISGPTLFTAADSAMYALVLAHLGPQLMAVTSELSLRFLSKAAPADVLAEARALKFGRRLVVMEVRLWTLAAAERVVAHATGTYALP